MFRDDRALRAKGAVAQFFLLRRDSNSGLVRGIKKKYLDGNCWPQSFEALNLWDSSKPMGVISSDFKLWS